MVKGKEAIQSIIARHIDCKPEQVFNTDKLFVDDITMSDVLLMVNEIIYLTVNETIENGKAHTECPGYTDWDGTQVNTLNQLGI